MRASHIVRYAVLTLLAVAAVAASGCGGQGPEAKIGDSAGNTKVQVTVHKVWMLGKVTTEDGKVLSSAGGKGVYVLIDMTVDNLQDSELTLRPDDVRVSTTDGFWSWDRSLTVEFPDEYQGLARNIGPGKKARGTVTYLIPAGTPLEKFTYVGGSDPDITVNLAMTVKAPKAERPPGIGQTAKGGGLAVTVHKVSYPSRLSYGAWTTSPKAGSKLVMLDVTLKNVARKPSYHVDPLALRIIDAKGTRWGSYDRSEPGLAPSAQLPLKTIKPGAQVHGVVVISVPDNAKLKRVLLEAGVLGPPLEIRVTK